MHNLLPTTLSRLAFLSTVLLGFGAAPAFGQESDRASSLVLEEIVVTAQKREQSLQDIAAAVTNLSGDDLDVLNVTDAFDLSDKVPGLVLNNVQGYRRTISIRGIGNELPDNAATKPGVAYHIDGVFMSNDFALFQDLVDIERIEVTRGPDGTIFGNSSSGGAINVITKKPNVDQAGGYLDGEFGSYSTLNVRGSFNIPLSDNTAVKVSVSQRSHDGYTENEPNPNASALNVLGAFNDLDDENDTSIMGQLLWQPSESFSALLSFHDFDMDINGPALKGGFDTVSNDPRVVSHDTTEFFKVENSHVSLVLDWSGAAVDVKAVVSVQDYKMQRTLDADRSSLTANDPAPLPPLTGVLLGEFPIRQHVGGLTQEDETFTAELNVSSSQDSDSLFEWQIGAFFLDTEIESNTRNFVDRARDGLPVNTSIIGFGNPDRDFQNSDFRNFESQSVFGQVRFKLSDAAAVTAGARWTNNNFTDERCNIFNGCLTAEGRTGAPATPSSEESNVTFKVALDYSLSDDNMVYFSVSNGIKPAASNNGFVDDRDGVGFFPEVFEEEEVTAYEIGSKNFFKNRRVQFNVAAFYYDIENYLFVSAGLNVFGGGVSGGSNLPEAEEFGVEIESIFALSDNLRLDATLTFTESDITSSRLAVDRGEQVNVTAGLSDPAEITAAILAISQDLKGNDLPKIPDMVALVRLTHESDIAGQGLLTSSLTYHHRGDYFSRVFNGNRDLVEAYDLVHLNFNYQPEDSNLSFSLNLQNLFDSDEISSVHTDDFFQGVTSFQLLPPRLVTLRVRYDF